MRIKGEKVDIDYEKTKEFFESRGDKYNEAHPYVTTMYQDAHPQLTEARNQEEVRRILPLLELGADSRILDMGCGIGRWADAVGDDILSYLGVDFSHSLIEIARARNTRRQFSFEQMSVCDFGEYYQSRNLAPFNRLIIAGVLMYLNDTDAEHIFHMLSEILTDKAIVYIREPVGISERLTLKDFYSQELAHDYHTIYRSADEYRDMIQTYAPEMAVGQEGFLFGNLPLNNRKETSQYYFIMRKEALQ